MPKYSSMAMSEALTALNTIDVRKSFFGLKKDAYYKPTNSILEGYELYISATASPFLKRLMEVVHKEELDRLVESGRRMEYNANGSERLDVCQSKDKKFIALQSFRYDNYYYRKTSEIKYFEGNEAEKVSEMLEL